MLVLLLLANSFKSITKLCVNLFLPAMLLTDMGSHISLKTLKEFWPLVAIPIVMIVVTYFMGRFTVRFFSQPTYIVPGVVFNNAVAMPLLLLEAISNSDVLFPLLRKNETVEQGLVRARAYILLHGMVHNLARFALGPMMLRHSGPSDDRDVEQNSGPTERTALLQNSDETDPLNGDSPVDRDTFLRQRARLLSVSSIDLDETDALLRGYKEVTVKVTGPDGTVQFKRRGTLSNLFGAGIPKLDSNGIQEAETLLERAQGNSEVDSEERHAPRENHKNSYPSSRFHRVITAIEEFLNPAVASALLAIFIGITPPLHYLFYDNVAISSSVTQSIKSLGGLYPALQLFALGSKLTTPLKRAVRKSTIVIIAIIRFGLAGLISISIVYFMTTHVSPDIWPMDPMLNFVLMITPVGPPAITLAAVAEIAGVSSDEVTAVSRMLLYTYAISPLVAPSVAIALSLAYQIGRA